jgi:hypothetical protein
VIAIQFTLYERRRKALERRCGVAKLHLFHWRCGCADGGGTGLRTFVP